MPTPERTTLDTIISAAARILEEDGLAGVTMQAVAQRVGVRAPSLYKRVESRETLIRLVAEDALVRITTALDGLGDLESVAGSLRAFGQEWPAAFLLVMAPSPGTPVPRQEFRDAASATLLRLAADAAGHADALEAARTLTAWATGFIGMEINGAFTLGGDIEDAWRFGLTRVVDSLRPDRVSTPRSR